MVTCLGLLALILYAQQQTGRKTPKSQTKQYQGISEYASGGTKYPKRGRKQVSNCIQDESALKTLNACKCQKCLHPLSAQVYSTQRSESSSFKYFQVLLGIKKNLTLLYKRSITKLSLCKDPWEKWVQCHGLPWSLGSHSISIPHVNPELQEGFSPNGSRNLRHQTIQTHLTTKLAAKSKDDL